MTPAAPSRADPDSGDITHDISLDETGFDLHVDGGDTDTAALRIDTPDGTRSIQIHSSQPQPRDSAVSVAPSTRSPATPGKRTQSDTDPHTEQERSPTMRHTTIRRLGAGAMTLSALGLLAAGCGDDDTTASTDTSSADNTMNGGSHDGPPAENTGDARHIEVAAKSFSFEPEEIRATVGEELAIALTSTDGEHDFVIDEFDVDIHAPDAGNAFGQFTPDEPGTYTIYCSVPGHRDAGMEAELIIEEATP